MKQHQWTSRTLEKVPGMPDFSCFHAILVIFNETPGQPIHKLFENMVYFNKYGEQAVKLHGVG
ncbi:MAG: hypothetical protein QXU13_05945 [Desulfurococcaceae archaeon]